jgi:hypothetical protein
MPLTVQDSKGIVMSGNGQAMKTFVPKIEFIPPPA